MSTPLLPNVDAGKWVEIGQATIDTLLMLGGALPLTLLMTTKGDRTGAGAAQDDWEWAVLANNAGVFGYVCD